MKKIELRDPQGTLIFSADEIDDEDYCCDLYLDSKIAKSKVYIDGKPVDITKVEDVCYPTNQLLS
jgi:hypothetical protein